MKFLQKYWQRLILGAPVILFAVSMLQLLQVGDTYALLWLKRIWRNRDQTAFERSANFYLGDSGTKFMRFLDETIPVDKAVVVAERSAQFSHQEILQYFLFPRPIVACSCDLGQACTACLMEPDHYVPITSQFPPPEFSAEQFAGIKQYLPASVGSDYYLGVYTPLLYASFGEAQTFKEQSFDLLRLLILDLTILLALGLFGGAIVHLILPALSWIETGSLAIPVGTGIFTWVLFLTSWAGFSLTPLSVILVYLACGMLVFGAAKLTGTNYCFHRPNFHSPDFQWINLVGWCVIGLTWTLLVILAVGRSYSLFDDIVIWSAKGHGIAYAGSIFAGRLLGGHGLAYPLNIPLLVTIFTIFDGDLLPGSKFFFPFALLALLVGVYRFCRRHGVSALIATGGTLLILTTPAIFFYGTSGFANIPFTSYLVLGTLWSFEGLEQDNPRVLLLGGLLLALAGWTRPEGLPYAFVLAAALLAARWVTRQPLHFHVSWLLPLLVITGSWLIFATHFIAGDQAGGALKGLSQQVMNGQINLNPLKTLVIFIAGRLFSGVDWRYLMPLVLFFLLAALVRQGFRPGPLIPMLLIVTLASFGFVIAIFFILSEPDFVTFLEVSFDRAFFPTVVLLIVTGLMAFRRNFD